MTHRIAALAALSALAGLTTAVHAQTALHAVRANGDVIAIDPASGAGSLLGHSGLAVSTGGAASAVRGSTYYVSWTELFPLAVSQSEAQATFAWVSPCTGQVTQSQAWSDQPVGTEVRAVAGDPAAAHNQGVYLILETPAGESLSRLDIYDGDIDVTAIGPTGRDDLVAMARSDAGVLYALGTDNGGALYTLDASTGAATLVGPVALGDARSLAFDSGGLLACGSDLIRIDPTTAAASVIGPTGFTDIRGLAVTPGCVPPNVMCYVNCDGSLNPPPILNVNDFLCFQYRFTTGDPYANCDGSTIPPVLNVNDFICFMSRFWGGC